MPHDTPRHSCVPLNIIRLYLGISLKWCHCYVVQTGPLTSRYTGSLISCTKHVQTIRIKLMGDKGWCLNVKHAHLRAAQEIVELDPADGGVGLEVWEHVTQQKSRHDGFCSAVRYGKNEAGQWVGRVGTTWMDPDKGGANLTYRAYLPANQKKSFFFSIQLYSTGNNKKTG